MRISSIQALCMLLLVFFLQSCDNEVIVPDNDAPNYSEISTILIENYVNRTYIDLIGREPLDSEMVAEVTILRNADLAFSARREMAEKLQTDTSYVFGDSSYRRAYYHRLYNLAKARVIEGASNAEINQEVGILANQVYQDSVNGDWPSYEKNKAELEKYLDILRCDFQYEQGLINIDTVFARMVNNGIYDFINMNTFNFVNATYDNLLYRYPTSAEFDAAYNVVEYNQSDLIFGKSASNKDEYILALVASREFYEGCIIWAYINLLQREPTSLELNKHMQYFYTDKDFQRLQLDIIITDEYAGFD